MRFLTYTLKLIAAFYIARNVADLILGNNYFTVFIFLSGVVYFLFLSVNKKFIIFSVMAFIPFTFSGLEFPFPLKHWLEYLTPILFLFFLLENLSEKRQLFPKKTALHLSAIGVLALWAAVSYVQYPVVGGYFGGLGLKEAGLRDYAIISSGIMIFFCSFWFFRYKKLDAKKWLFLLLILSLIIGNLRIIGYFKEFAIPFFTGQLSSENCTTDKCGIGGGLREMAAIAFSAVLCLFYKRKLNIYLLLALINSLVFSVLSGGRGIFIGILLAFAVYVILLNRRYFLPLAAPALIFIGIYLLYSPDTALTESKYARVVALEGGLKEQSSDRYYSYLYMWEVFKDSPVFGKGVGYRTVELDDEFFRKHPEAIKERENIEGMIFSGSHGSYMSMLSTFGIGGVFFMAVMVFVSMYYSYRIFKKNNEYTQLALFPLIYLIISSVSLTVGGAGFDVWELWFFAGVIAGIRTKEVDVRERVIQTEASTPGLMWAEK